MIELIIYNFRNDKKNENHQRQKSDKSKKTECGRLDEYLFLNKISFESFDKVFVFNHFEELLPGQVCLLSLLERYQKTDQLQLKY